MATTVLEFVATLGKVYGHDVCPELRGEFRPGDFCHLFADTSSLRPLGWAPQIVLEEGLQRYAAWIQNHNRVEEYVTEARTPAQKNLGGLAECRPEPKPEYLIYPS